MYQDDDARLVPRSSVRSEAGFTLVEVLVALVIVLIGAYAALYLFPTGFAAIERSRHQSMAASLAEQEIQHWRLAAASLPEAIVWAQVSGPVNNLTLTYSTDYDPGDLTPNADNPDWQPDSVYLPRTIIGEMLPVGDVTVDLGGGVTAIRVPLCRLRYGPLEHLYAVAAEPNPANRDPLFIYTSEYERVDRADALAADKDWGRYYINCDAGTISFDRAPGYDRQYRVEFTYLAATGVGSERRYEMTDTAQMITVPGGWDSRPTGTAAGQGPLSLWPTTRTIDVSPAGAVRLTNVVTITTTAPHGFAVGQKVIIAGVTGVGLTDFNGTFTITGMTPTTFTYDQTEVNDTGGGGTAGPLPADFAGVVPLSERVHQALIFDGIGAPSGAGHFALTDAIADPSAYLLFDPGDAGRTVNVDYRVRDWQILVEERSPDAATRLRLAAWPVKSPQYVNRPRQPNPDRIIPTDAAAVIVLDTQTGAPLDLTKLDIDYNNGVISNRAGASPAQLAAGHTYRTYYRGKLDWTVQPMKAAADYAVLVGGAPPIGYREALWAQGTNTLQFGRSEVGKSVLAEYHYDASGGPRLVSGELGQVGPQGGRGEVRLARVPGTGGIRVEGASMRVRVLWAQRGRTQAVGGELSPERWNQVPVETFLRRP